MVSLRERRINLFFSSYSFGGIIDIPVRRQRGNQI
jgi:hypothetical protein